MVIESLGLALPFKNILYKDKCFRNQTGTSELTQKKVASYNVRKYVNRYTLIYGLYFIGSNPVHISGNKYTCDVSLQLNFVCSYTHEFVDFFNYAHNFLHSEKSIKRETNIQNTRSESANIFLNFRILVTNLNLLKLNIMQIFHQIISCSRKTLSCSTEGLEFFIQRGSEAHRRISFFLVIVPNNVGRIIRT